MRLRPAEAIDDESGNNVHEQACFEAEEQKYGQFETQDIQKVKISGNDTPVSNSPREKLNQEPRSPGNISMGLTKNPPIMTKWVRTMDDFEYSDVKPVCQLA